MKKKKLDFVIVNGENAADSGVGITKKNTEEFFEAGAAVITSGNHIWDEKETMEFITTEKRLLRPENLIKGSPGMGTGIFNAKNNFARLYCFGFAASFFVYVAVNMSMVLGLLPIVGAPLPIMSYGGSAMLAMMMGFGIVMSCKIHHQEDFA